MLGLAASMVPLPFVGSLVVMGAVLFVAGFAISPTLIALTAWVEQVVPTGRLTEGMAIVHTGIAGGVAPGAVLAGTVIDRAGASAAYVVPVAAGALGVLAALVARDRVRSPEAVLTPEAASPTGSSW
jgi:predicted MFS family arabinose efflux permease